MKQLKTIAVRCEDDLYYMIKACSLFANNSMGAYCENILKQNIAKIYNMIPVEKLDEIKKKMGVGE